jgi:hypothetical protein
MTEFAAKAWARAGDLVREQAARGRYMYQAAREQPQHRQHHYQNVRSISQLLSSDCMDPVAICMLT